MARCTLFIRGRTKSGWLWALARDDRPWGGADPPAVAFLYAEGRRAEDATAHLEGFSGLLQVDAREFGPLAGRTGYSRMRSTTPSGAQGRGHPRSPGPGRMKRCPKA